jgi:hypothetical protein
MLIVYDDGLRLAGFAVSEIRANGVDRLPSKMPEPNIAKKKLSC